jgi:hypothetical protein
LTFRESENILPEKPKLGEVAPLWTFLSPLDFQSNFLCLVFSLFSSL